MNEPVVSGFRTSFIDLSTGREAVPIKSIEIPMIQRDYAQGRDSGRVRDVRTSFLDALHRAIASDDILSLDFVYGDVAGDVLRPLDGQQRLTTLFLLHWYLGRSAGVEIETHPWTNFAYATRPSAELFCRRLVTATPPAMLDSLSGWIEDQPWYQYVWRHDPTIQAMLVMLDAIRERFADTEPAVAWARLTDASDPAVSFYVLPIAEIGAGDELYIKMNSRGKPLTEFEVFKARLEEAVAHLERAEEFAHKIDTTWSDLLWAYRGDDNLVDDEFMRYMAYLLDICEWRLELRSPGNLAARARSLFASPTGAQALDFMIACFDTWVGEDISAWFEKLFREPSVQVPHDARPTLFTPEWLNGTDLIGICCRNYGEMLNARTRSFPLGLSIMLYGVLMTRLHEDADVSRLRFLRNLVAASDNEIRDDSMPELLRETERLIRGADLSSIQAFNALQLEDERRKAQFLTEHATMAAAVRALEDHRILRGNLEAFELDAARIAPREQAFQTVFADSSTWRELSGAFLACGPYQRRRSDLSFRFGSPATDREAIWRTLFTGPAKTPASALREPLGHLLDRVSDAPSPTDLSYVYERISTDWLDEREQLHAFDWRYHMVRHPVMRSGATGIYVTEKGYLGYEMCMLTNGQQLNSHYRDPWLSAVHHASGLVGYRVHNPLFTGYESNERWLRLATSEAGIRCRESGWAIQVSEGDRDAVRAALPDDLQFTGTPDGFFWSAPQRDEDGSVVDTVDRVEVGVRILTALSETLEPEIDSVTAPVARESLDLRATRLNALIGRELAALGILRRRWISTPKLPRTRTWVAFELKDRTCIELMARWEESSGVTFLLKAYPTFGRPAQVFHDFDHIPFDADWETPDNVIVERFLAATRSVQSAHPRAS